eukprot:1184149-Amphidinium_carterae.4
MAASVLRGNAARGVDGVDKSIFTWLKAGDWENLAVMLNDIAAARAPMPTQWMQMPIVLLPKRPLITEPRHTRPVGIRPLFCKLYDKLVTDLLKPYLSQLPSWICGFRPGM